MNDTQYRKSPQGVLVLVQVIREYRLAEDGDGLCRLLFPLEQWFSGEKYEPPKNPAERLAFSRLLDAAKRARESFEKCVADGRRGGLKSAENKRALETPKARQVGKLPFSAVASAAVGGDKYAALRRDPVGYALEYTGETGELARNTFKKYLREKGAEQFCRVLETMIGNSSQGEDPQNRGRALNAELSKLPNIGTRGASAQ